VLILGFNRPELIKKVIKALGNSKPELVLVAVDGPRTNVNLDKEKVKEVQEAIELINWKTKIETRFRKENLGIRKAVPDAVSWAIEKYGRVIVLEDDAIPSLDFVDYMNFALEKFASDTSVGHLSGYNQVPQGEISNNNLLFRKSMYPESYAWATWQRAWDLYEDQLIGKPEEILEKQFSRLVWKNYFKMAEKDLLSTWAFRWIASLWRHQLLSVSPNINLVEYVGQIDGTHTRTRPRAPEQPIGSIITQNPYGLIELDLKADAWTSDIIFRENLYGLIEGKLSKFILRIMKN